MFEKSILSNGLRVVTSHMSHTRSVSIGFYVGAGSRYEDDSRGGVSHLIEHMLFKGTSNRPAPADISTTIESVGGIINASTDREMTVYWTKVARPHFILAFDLLVDMVRNSLIDPDELTREKAVVLEELSMSNDSPASRSAILLDEVLWPNQPLGRDIGGTRESVLGITRETLFAYLGHQYVPSNVVVAVAGNVSHGEVVETAEKTLGEWKLGNSLDWHAAVDSQSEPQLRIEHRKTDQAQMCLAVKGISIHDPRRYALDLLNTVLGGGMSSRLFLEMREKRGLAYDVHSAPTHYQDCGDLAIFCGVDPRRVGEALSVILEQLACLREGVTIQELQKAKEMLKGRLLLRLEDTRAVAGWLGAQELLRNEVLTPEETVSRVEQVSEDELKDLASDLFITDKLNFALVGPLRSAGRIQKLLRL